MTSYKKGDRVEGRFGDDWFPGTVTAVRHGSKADDYKVFVYALFDDGDKDRFRPRSVKLRHAEPKAVRCPGCNAYCCECPEEEPEPEPLREDLRVSTRRVFNIGHLDELDTLIAKMEALRKVAATCGGRRYIRFPTGMDGHELVLQIDLTGTALERTTERRNADGSTGYVTLDPPKRKPKADDFTDRVHDAPPLRRGRRAPSNRK